MFLFAGWFRFALKALLHVGFALVFFALTYFLVSTWHDPAVRTARALEQMPDCDYLPEIQHLREGGRVAEAVILGQAVLELDEMPNAAEIRRLVQEMEQDYDRWQRKAVDFLDAFFTGRGDSGSSMVGKTISDFLVIGDLRDLAIQGGKAVQGEETDGVIIALSAAGVVASVAAFVPEPSSTAAGVTATPILSTFKGLRRIGALSRRFSSHLAQVMRQVSQTRSWHPAQNIMENMGTVMKRAPVGGIPSMMRHVDTADDLGIVARWTVRTPKRTWAALHMGGQQALGLMAAGGKRADHLLGLALRKGAVGVRSIRIVSRPAKFLIRGRVQEWQAPLRDLAMSDPRVRDGLQWLTLLFLLCGTGSLFRSGWCFRKVCLVACAYSREKRNRAKQTSPE